MHVTRTPRRSIHSRKSGGTHIRTSWPRSRNATASATSGWTSPRDPIVDSSTRMRIPLPGLRRIALHPLVNGDRIPPEVLLRDRSRLRGEVLLRDREHLVDWRDAVAVR